MTRQPSLFSLERQLVETFEKKPSTGEPNPFRRLTGECEAGCVNENAVDDTPRRVFWCWKCEKKFCWNCLLSHKDG